MKKPYQKTALVWHMMYMEADRRLYILQGLHAFVPSSLYCMMRTYLPRHSPFTIMTVEGAVTVATHCHTRWSENRGH